MPIQDDETLQMYLEESIEHLADIETDLLSIEEDGAEINEDLVNKVYRAAHSIKGGAGFMGLTTIKDLTHEMENILGKIRSREMVPTLEIINILLSASDTLKALMNDVFTSNEVDISQHINDLQAIAAGRPLAAAPVPPATDDKATARETAPADKAVSQGQVTIAAAADPDVTLSADEAIVKGLMDEGKWVYLVKINIARDIIEKGKSTAVVVEDMEQTGTLIATSMDMETVKTMKPEEASSAGPFVILFGTILKPEDINVLFDLPDHQIHQVSTDLTTQALGAVPTDVPETKPEPIVAPPKASPPPVLSPVETVEGPTLSTTSKTQPKRATEKPESKKVETDTSLRVHVSLLDQLMTLAGELVLSRNQLLQSMSSEDHRGAEIAGQRIDLITSELQEAIMLTRMQSIGNVFNKFPRVVRDLSQSLGKRVDLHLEGKDVELDKTIIEAIGDPLTHLVRNAVDHGIEMPDVRQRCGKPQVGKIYLKAYHEAGQVNIEISDDGKGLDGHVLTQKALEKGLISEDQAKVMSEKERINLIFLPGFSTAEKITDVSGRGVGMDVVKTNLDKLGGIIDIVSELGKGSTIRIKLPLTLAIIPCQIVMTGLERYAIPQVNLEELLRIPANQVKDRIERVGDAEVVRLRGNLLPLIKLSEVIDTRSVYVDPKTGQKRIDRRQSLADRRSKQNDVEKPQHQNRSASTEGKSEDALKTDPRSMEDRRYHAASALNIVVVSTGAMKYGLVVDELHDSEEIVVKPLGRDLKKCKGYAGATIMGDGRVALILDVANLAQMAGLASLEGSSRAAEVAEENRRAIREQKDRQSLLVFRSAEKEQFAAPLNMVERIEKIKSTDIETVGGKRIIRYRGGSLPLFSVDEVAMVQPLADVDDLLVIVFILNGREIGLLAIGPVDAVELSLDVDGQTLKQPGIMGSAIINDHTTLMVDVYEIVQTLNPQWFESMETVTNENGEAAKILFAEDSNFFRNQVKSYMEDEGYTVIEAEDGAIAWDLLQQHADEISLVVTDIEMPNMNGFELTQRIKESNAFSHLPVIALTTLAGEEDIEKGRQVGISDYQIKLDREKLIRSIYGFLSNL